jgi:hypothetical protein
VRRDRADRAALVTGLLAIALGLLSPRAGWSATIQWDGDSGTNYNWATAGNWAGGVVHTSSDIASFVDLPVMFYVSAVTDPTNSDN